MYSLTASDISAQRMKDFSLVQNAGHIIDNFSSDKIDDGSIE